jgi:phosphoenolpyruvate phosphomutase / 2-hydroxyethylphosphonate cytidylyltransferase
MEKRVQLMENELARLRFDVDELQKRPRVSDAAPLVYIGMAADIIHHGHINVIKTGALYGKVVLGLLTDEAIMSYKRKPVVPWEKRKLVAEHLKGISLVIPQDSLDYRPNLMALKPQFVVHGSDWKTGPQAETRQQVIDTLGIWGGSLVEPEYTKGISTTYLISACGERVAYKQ